MQQHILLTFNWAAGVKRTGEEGVGDGERGGRNRVNVVGEEGRDHVK